jgi:hypothetical protein
MQKWDTFGQLAEAPFGQYQRKFNSYETWLECYRTVLHVNHIQFTTICESYDPQCKTLTFEQYCKHKWQSLETVKQQ